MNENNMISNSVCHPSATVKLNFNEMDKSELLQMLAFIQSELEAREIVIATLKSEKCKQLLYQAKYGRLNTAIVSPKTSDNWPGCNTNPIFSIYDPFAAMQRDIQCVISGDDSTVDCNVESNLKPVYDNQLNQLENLILSQKKAQQKMKEQIMHLEKKCVKLTQALEDERNKHERDAAQGDDVLVMLEKERERLKTELEYEKSHSRKLERELKRLMAVIEDQRTVIQNQRLAASVILKTKKRMESDVQAVNAIINRPIIVADSDKSEVAVNNAEEMPEKMLTNQESYICSLKSCSNETSERHKKIPDQKTSYTNMPDGQSTTKPGTKHSQTNEATLPLSVTLPESIVTPNHPVGIPLQKSRTGKQPESLLWKTYDPKVSLPSSGHTKSPSNSRRQMPSHNAIPGPASYHKHPSAPSPSGQTPRGAITPYQKILSTPPPISIISQAASFQSSLTSYSLFNICSPTLQTHSTDPATAAAYKSPKSDLGPGHPLISSTCTARSRLGTSPNVPPSPGSSPAIIRTSDCNPAIPKHVYVNGK